MQNDVWGTGATVKLRLTEVLRMVRMWQEKVARVAKTWGVRWEEDNNVKEFVNRVEEVVGFRNQYDELVKVG